MAQTPCVRVSEGKRVDHTFAADAKAGVVVEVGTVPMIVSSAVDYSEQARGELDVGGLWDIPQAAEIINAGDAVYWDNNGTPVTGDASSGAATATATGNNLMGLAAPLQPNGTTATAATDTYVRVILTAAKRTTTIAGSVTASDITGEDSSLAIAGKAGAAGGAGGAVPIAGGAGHTNGAGGAAGVTGGAGAGTGAGGATNLTGGTSGTGATGNGGASSLVGGAALSTNGTGGAASVTGGVATGTGTGGAVTITSGASAGASGTAGAVAIDAGAATGGTGGAIAIGGTNAASVNIGNATSTSAAAGTWTFAKMFRIPVNASVAVGGTAQANANAVGEGFTVVTGADDTAAVKLPAAVAGAVVIIKSSTASKNLVVFPGASDAINALSANASYNFTSDAGMGLFVAADATTWYTLPLDA
jgi:hypothetical protein